jgi:hypothetical protein
MWAGGPAQRKQIFKKRFGSFRYKKFAKMEGLFSLRFDIIDIANI